MKGPRCQMGISCSLASTFLRESWKNESDS
jgi:hypothetical protein